ncbi:MAG: MotA/TolQ/ExbB proton channel family protein [Gammaproteobacteria bacterium]|nr:MotA/TolQ/ExbB proton channel family protein [Gammaproteobacteria bacterium]
MPDNAAAFSAFYRWLILFGLLLAGAYVAADLGLVETVWSTDRSRISIVILAAFVLASLDAGRRAYRLGNEIRRALALSAQVRQRDPLFVLDDGQQARFAQPPGHDSFAHHHLLLLANKTLQHRALCDQTLLLERLENTLGRGHETGWFLADLMIRLGLLGTVIGFIVMLGSVSSVSSIDLPALQQLLTNMSDGMRIALYTTLTGLCAGILLGFQYRLLDNAVDHLMAEVIELSEVHVAPQLRALIGH